MPMFSEDRPALHQFMSQFALPFTPSHGLLQLSLRHMPGMLLEGGGFVVGTPIPLAGLLLVLLRLDRWSCTC
jgi:hypothetical protein